MSFDQHTELQLMEALEAEPETTQADLAAKAGVAVGTVNWYLKRWSGKGYVIVKRMNRWRWRYLLTPKGMAEKGRLASQYVEVSMRIYRNTRSQAKDLLGQVHAAGYEEVVIEGEGDIVDICQLTCLEFGLKQAGSSKDSLPVVKVREYDLELIWPVSDEIEADLVNTDG